MARGVCVEEKAGNSAPVGGVALSSSLCRCSFLPSLLLAIPGQQGGEGGERNPEERWLLGSPQLSTAPPSSQFQKSFYLLIAGAAFFPSLAIPGLLLRSPLPPHSHLSIWSPYSGVVWGWGKLLNVS